jgi:hypothetical protein
MTTNSTPTELGEAPGQMTTVSRLSPSGSDTRRKTSIPVGTFGPARTCAEDSAPTRGSSAFPQ